ncbi:transcription factor Adf-1-like [Schistocerca cancellata]|uniref:transcription factor Adf-1-like n=1 Tax=Schistocerca cancellata TaxID=274614 RepID=UPI0021193AF6|nr:transcription factor Adf-1-like [Schistocerca cancellata]
MDVERLINNVRERPVLWDQKNKYYRNRDFVRQAWNEIAEDCGTDSEVLKNEWKNLRDTFRSELKKTRAECSGDEGGMLPFQSNWPWYELMTFLTDIMTPPKTKTNVHHSKRTASQHDDAHEGVPFSPALTERESVSPDETNQASSSRLSVSSEGSVSMPPPSPTLHTNQNKRSKKSTNSELLNIEKQKLKLIEQQMSKSETQDDSYHFVVSLLPAMRKLSSAAQLRVRIKIQQVLLEELEESTTSTAHSLMSPYAPENPVEIVIAGNPQNETVISEIQPDDIDISSHQDSENFDT